MIRAGKISAEDLGGAKTAMEKVFDAKTIQEIERLGYTAHPGFIRAMLTTWKRIATDEWVQGSAAFGERSGDARAMFPRSNHAP